MLTLLVGVNAKFVNQNVRIFFLVVIVPFYNPNSAFEYN
jgi:hypothetical protein